MGVDADAVAVADFGLTEVDMNTPERRATAQLQVLGVSKTYAGRNGGVTALSRIDLAINKNDFVCIVGPSGCGKSTLLNAIAGFEHPTEGEVTLGGRTVRGPAAERGVVFQQGALFDWMTVEENVKFGPLARGLGDRVARDLADRYIAMVGLSGFAQRFPHELSGGMQQRVGIARALANEPEVLLMDEPFAALDQQNREILQAEIKEIWRKTGNTVIWITHSIEEALFLGTHVLVMSARPGRIKGAFRTNFNEGDQDLLTSKAFFDAKRDLYQLLRDEAAAAANSERRSA
jgi:ABC-type nitrate/sulfonate/bicarbonate transport system ATPase subunit